MVETQRMDRLRIPSLMALAAYIAALLFSTHLPKLPDVLIPLGEYDKWIHGGMYAGLVIVIAWNWSLYRELGWRQWATVLAMCAAFGFFDELTQILVGRTCDFLDWLADMLGASIGLAASVAAATRFRRPREV